MKRVLGAALLFLGAWYFYDLLTFHKGGVQTHSVLQEFFCSYEFMGPQGTRPAGRSFVFIYVGATVVAGVSLLSGRTRAFSFFAWGTVTVVSLGVMMPFLVSLQPSAAVLRGMILPMALSILGLVLKLDDKSKGTL